MEGFGKKDKTNVKSVILPVSGQSYNPSIRSHMKLLKEVAITEEKGVEKKLKELRQ